MAIASRTTLTGAEMSGGDLDPAGATMSLGPSKEGPLMSTVPTQRRSRQRRSTPTPVRAHSPASPLTRPDGSAAPVVHLVPELSPYARTGGLGEAVSSLAKHQAASGIPVTVFVPLYGVIRERTELRPVGPAFAVNVGPRIETARLYEPAEALAPGAPRVIFVESAEYFDRPGL
jgi:starch synthase